MTLEADMANCGQFSHCSKSCGDHGQGQGFIRVSASRGGRGKLKCPQGPIRNITERGGLGEGCNHLHCRWDRALLSEAVRVSSSWVWLFGDWSQVLTRSIFSHKVENSDCMWDPQIFKCWQLIHVFHNKHCRSVISVWERSWSLAPDLF